MLNLKSRQKNQSMRILLIDPGKISILARINVYYVNTKLPAKPCTKFRQNQSQVNSRDIARTNTDKNVGCRLSILQTTDDKLAGMTSDMRYHLPRLVKCQLNAKQSVSIDESSTAQMLSNLETVDWVSCTLNSNETNISMNYVQTVYS